MNESSTVFVWLVDCKTLHHKLVEGFIYTYCVIVIAVYVTIKTVMDAM